MNSNQLLETSNDTNQMHLARLHYQPEGCQPAGAKRLKPVWEVVCEVVIVKPSDKGKGFFSFVLKTQMDKLATHLPYIKVSFKVSNNLPLPPEGMTVYKYFGIIWGILVSSFM